MNNKLKIDREKFLKEGYLVIKNVFTPEEIKQIRNEAYQAVKEDEKKNLAYKYNASIAATFVKGDLLSKEILRHVLLDERILTIARTILNGDIVYFGDSSYQIGTGSRGFHRDNIDRKDLTAPDWQGDYTIIRMGIYLQDHKNYSGGLKVRKGSHLNKTGEAVFVDSEVGDVVVWSLKTLHSGNAVRLKWLKDLTINIAQLEKMVPKFLREEEQAERISMFMTFGLKSKHLERYVNQYMLKRQEVIEHLQLSKFDDGIYNLAKSKKLEILKVIPEYGTN